MFTNQIEGGFAKRRDPNWDAEVKLIMGTPWRLLEPAEQTLEDLAQQGEVKVFCNKTYAIVNSPEACKKLLDALKRAGYDVKSQGEQKPVDEDRNTEINPVEEIYRHTDYAIIKRWGIKGIINSVKEGLMGGSSSSSTIDDLTIFHSWEWSKLEPSPHLHEALLRLCNISPDINYYSIHGSLTNTNLDDLERVVETYTTLDINKFRKIRASGGFGGMTREGIITFAHFCSPNPEISANPNVFGNMELMAHFYAPDGKELRKSDFESIIGSTEDFTLFQEWLAGSQEYKETEIQNILSSLSKNERIDAKSRQWFAEKLHGMTSKLN